MVNAHKNEPFHFYIIIIFLNLFSKLGSIYWYCVMSLSNWFEFTNLIPKRKSRQKKVNENKK